jgi:hypothetical protein
VPSISRIARVLLFAFAAIAILAAIGCFTGVSGESPFAQTLPDASIDTDSTPGEPDDAGATPVDDGSPADARSPDDTAAPAGPFSIGGTVTGLSGTGLVLSLNDGSVLGVSANGAFAFPAAFPAGQQYAVTIAALPTGPTQVCTVTSGAGTANANVTSVVVTCVTNAYSVGGTVVGLMAAANAGLVLANGVETVTVAANGPFTFPTKVASGAQFDVTVDTSPTSPAQTCTVSGGTGTVGGAAVTSVVVNCATNAYVIGGTATHLVGTGLVLDNGTDMVAVTANGTFAFPTPVASGGTYAVTVGAQPTRPSQTCAVSMGSGTVASTPINSVGVDCVTNTYAVGGTVTGLAGTGLTLALQDANGQPLEAESIAAAGPFAFNTAIASGAGYKVVVQAQPTGPTQACQVTSGGSGTIGAGPATVTIACQTTPFTVGGMIRGLTGTGLVLTDNGVDSLGVASGATTFTFATKVLSGAPFDVEVATNPAGPSQSCTVAGNKGNVGNGPVTSVTVNCGTNSFGISGTVTKLVGTGLRLTDGTDTIDVTSGTFSFPALPSGTPYTIAVSQQPSNPTQKCTVTAGAMSTIGSAPITGVTVACVTSTFPISVSVTGLVASKNPLVVSDGADTANITANGTVKLPTPLASGTSYSLTVTQPTGPSQTCTVTSGNGSGTVGSGAITIMLSCKIDTATIAINVTGTIKTEKTPLQVSDGTDSVNVTADGTTTFPTAIASGSSYAIAITQPTGPSETCVVTSGNATGTITTAGTVTVTIACSWTVTVTVWGDGGTCGAFTLTDGAGTTCNVAASTQGGSQSCTFTYAGNSAYTIDSSAVFVKATGGLCSCFQSDATQTDGNELSYVNGTDGQNGFVFATGSPRTPGPASAYAVCQ